MVNMKNVCKIGARKLEGKEPLARHRKRWGCNIKMDLKEVGYEDVDWSQLTQGMVLVVGCYNLEPSCTMKWEV